MCGPGGEQKKKERKNWGRGRVLKRKIQNLRKINTGIGCAAKERIYGRLTNHEFQKREKEDLKVVLPWKLTCWT